MNQLKKVISIIFVFLGIAFIIFSFVTVPNSKKDKKNDHNNVIDNKEKEIRQIGFSLVQKITRNLNGLDYYNVFQNKKINAKDVDINILIANLINLYDNKNYDGCTDSDKEINGACSYVINLDEFKETFEKTYDKVFKPVDNIKGTLENKLIELEYFTKKKFDELVREIKNFIPIHFNSYVRE